MIKVNTKAFFYGSLFILMSLCCYVAMADELIGKGEIRVEYEGTEFFDGDTIDWGELPYLSGGQAEKQIRIHNDALLQPDDGGGFSYELRVEFDIVGAAADGFFFTSTLPTSINPVLPGGGTDHNFEDISLAFSQSDVPGIYEAQLVISQDGINAPDPVTIFIKGRIVDSQSGAMISIKNGANQINHNEVLEWGTVEYFPGDQIGRHIIVSNSGDTDLTVDIVLEGDEAFSHSTFPVMVPAANGNGPGSKDFALQMSQSLIGEHTAEITINHNAVNQNTPLQFGLHGSVENTDVGVIGACNSTHAVQDDFRQFGGGGPRIIDVLANDYDDSGRLMYIGDVIDSCAGALEVDANNQYIQVADVSNIPDGCEISYSAVHEDGTFVGQATLAIPQCAPVITSQPQSVFVNEGDSASLSVQVQDAQYLEEIAWYKVGESQVIGSGMILNLDVVTSDDEAQYYVKLTDSCAVTESQVVSVRIKHESGMGPLTGLNNYFADVTGEPVYLTGSHTWDNFQDYGGGSSRPDFDFNAYLTMMEAKQHNFIRLWVWESKRFWTSTNIPENITPMPWEQDSNGKFDLYSGDWNNFDFNQVNFNDSYFQRLKNRVMAAQAKNIYVSVMLFQGWSHYKKSFIDECPWNHHPFNLINNINGLNGDLNNSGQCVGKDGEEIHSINLDATSGSAGRLANLQKAYARQVIDTLNEYENVLYEISNEDICKESNYGGNNGICSFEWQKQMVDYIRQYQAGKANQHPVGITSINNTSNADLYASQADWISPHSNEGGLIDGTSPQWKVNPPIAGNKVVISDNDHMPGGDPQILGPTNEKYVRQWLWKNLTRGHNSIFMDAFQNPLGDWNAQDDPDFYNGTNPDNPVLPYVRDYMGHVSVYAEKFNLADAVPVTNTTKCSSGYCLIDEGARTYLLYQPDNNATTHLVLAPGTYEVQWFNPRTASSEKDDLIDGPMQDNTIRTGALTVDSESTQVAFDFPVEIDCDGSGLYECDVVLFLKARTDAPPAISQFANVVGFVNESATFRVTADGADEFKWYKLPDTNPISVSENAHYTIDVLSLDMNGDQYQVEACNDFGCRISEIATLTVKARFNPLELSYRSGGVLSPGSTIQMDSVVNNATVVQSRIELIVTNRSDETLLLNHKLLTKADDTPVELGFALSEQYRLSGHPDFLIHINKDELEPNEEAGLTISRIPRVGGNGSYAGPFKSGALHWQTEADGVLEDSYIQLKSNVADSDIYSSCDDYLTIRGSFGNVCHNDSLESLQITRNDDGAYQSIHGNQLNSSEDVVELGGVARNTSVTRRFIFTNQNNTAVDLTAAVLVGNDIDYSFQPDIKTGETIGAGQSIEVEMEFKSSDVGVIEDIIHLNESLDGNTNTLQLHATGVVGNGPVIRLEHLHRKEMSHMTYKQFPLTIQDNDNGGFASEVFHVKNEGNQNLNIEVSLEQSSDINVFSVNPGGNPSSETIIHGEHKSYVIRLNKDRPPGIYTAILHIEHDAENIAPSIRIPVYAQILEHAPAQIKVFTSTNDVVGQNDLLDLGDHQLDDGSFERYNFTIQNLTNDAVSINSEIESMLDNNQTGFEFVNGSLPESIPARGNVTLPVLLDKSHAGAFESKVRIANDIEADVVFNVAAQISDPPVSDDPQTPYNNQPQTIPGEIRPAYYDEGGYEKAYFDKSPGRSDNSNVELRHPDWVDLHQWVNSSEIRLIDVERHEWLEYTVNVTESGPFDVRVRYRETDGTNVYIKLTLTNTEGERTTAVIMLPGNTFDDSGNPQFQVVTLPNAFTAINASDTPHILRVEFTQSVSPSFQLNWLAFDSAQVPLPDVPIANHDEDANTECSLKVDYLQSLAIPVTCLLANDHAGTGRPGNQIALHSLVSTDLAAVELDGEDILFTAPPAELVREFTFEYNVIDSYDQVSGMAIVTVEVVAPDGWSPTPGDDFISVKEWVIGDDVTEVQATVTFYPYTLTFNDSVSGSFNNALYAPNQELVLHENCKTQDGQVGELTGGSYAFDPIKFTPPRFTQSGLGHTVFCDFNYTVGNSFSVLNSTAQGNVRLYISRDIQRPIAVDDEYVMSASRSATDPTILVVGYSGLVSNDSGGPCASEFPNCNSSNLRFINVDVTDFSDLQSPEIGNTSLRNCATSLDCPDGHPAAFSFTPHPNVVTGINNVPETLGFRYTFQNRFGQHPISDGHATIRIVDFPEPQDDGPFEMNHTDQVLALDINGILRNDIGYGELDILADIQQPAGADVSVVGDELHFVPTGGPGTYQFRYRIVDSLHEGPNNYDLGTADRTSEWATVKIIVHGPVPVAVTDEYLLPHNAAQLSINVPELLANDTPTGEVALSNVSQPDNGHLEIEDDVLIYKPNAGQTPAANGLLDSFNYSISYSNSQVSTTGTVNIYQGFQCAYGLTHEDFEGRTFALSFIKNDTYTILNTPDAALVGDKGLKYYFDARRVDTTTAANMSGIARDGVYSGDHLVFEWLMNLSKLKLAGAQILLEANSPSGDQNVKVEIRKKSNLLFELRMILSLNGNVQVSNWLEVDKTTHQLTLELTSPTSLASLTPGHLRLIIDNHLNPALSLDFNGLWRISNFDMGLVEGLDPGSHGSVILDQYYSCQGDKSAPITFFESFSSYDFSQWLNEAGQQDLTGDVRAINFPGTDNPVLALTVPPKTAFIKRDVSDHNSLPIHNQRLQFSLYVPESFKMLTGASHQILELTNGRYKSYELKIRRKSDGSYQARIFAYHNEEDGFRTSSFIDFEHGQWNQFTIDWHAATNDPQSHDEGNGRLVLTINQSETSSIENMDNRGLRYRKLSIGAVSGVNETTLGSYYIDDITLSDIDWYE